jgi:hypothetical protein
MNEEYLTKCISRYFKEPTINIDNLEKLYEYFEEYGKKSMQKKIVQKIFYIA